MATVPYTRQGNRGFTLLEVLVAFAIAALALGVMYRIYSKGTTSAILGKEYAAAVAIAESKLADIGVDVPLDTNDTSGTVNGKYEWQMTISDYKPDNEKDSGFEPPLRLKQIELIISWRSLGKQRSFTLHTIRPEPPQT